MPKKKRQRKVVTRTCERIEELFDNRGIGTCVAQMIDGNTRLVIMQNNDQLHDSEKWDELINYLKESPYVQVKVAPKRTTTVFELMFKTGPTSVYEFLDPLLPNNVTGEEGVIPMGWHMYAKNAEEAGTGTSGLDVYDEIVNI